ncbi:hypothetical protein MKX01_004430 [Papaver californicum]|nr:hypothetical protein MKX01_004430 [Papaver californicum]
MGDTNEVRDSLLVHDSSAHKNPSSSSSLILRLYVGHFLARWGASLVSMFLVPSYSDTPSIRFEHVVFEILHPHNGIPALSENDGKRKARFEQKNPVQISSSISTDTEILLSYKGSSSALEEHSWKQKVIKRLSKVAFFDAWIVYLQQDVVLPGVALSLLYFSVLSFGTLMTATLKWKGIPAYVIGIVRGFSATVDIAATLLYPILHSRISTIRTGLWSIWTQWSFLLLCAASIWIQNNNISAWMLMGGAAASRLGLWMFDLSVMQKMQDEVPDLDRCIVGVQNSLQSILHLLSYVWSIIVSNPKDFGKLTILSVLSTMLAAVLYTFHVYRVRKHLFHFGKFA